MGAITPVGNSTEAFWNSLKEKKVGIAPISVFDTTEYKAKVAAEVKDFDPKAYMDPKAAKRMERFSQFAVAASKEALEDAGISMEQEDPYRIGVSVGSGIEAFRQWSGNAENCLKKGRPGESAAGAHDDQQHGRRQRGDSVRPERQVHQRGDGLRHRNPLHRRSFPFHSVRRSGCDGGRRNGSQHYAHRRGRLYGADGAEHVEDPMRASIPFDKERDGFVMGEGSGIVVLEELEHAKARGAHIYAELIGYGATCDAYHITSPAEDGSGAAKAMEMAIADGRHRSGRSGLCQCPRHQHPS